MKKIVILSDINVTALINKIGTRPTSEELLEDLKVIASKNRRLFEREIFDPLDYIAVDVDFLHENNDCLLYDWVKQIQPRNKRELVIFVFHPDYPREQREQKALTLKNSFRGYNFLFYELRNQKDNGYTVGIITIENLLELCDHYKLSYKLRQPSVAVA